MAVYVFDLDGTIVHNGMPINEGIYKEILRISESNEVIFASARPVRDMLPLIPALLQDCLMIGCNGGMAWQKDSMIFCNFFKKEIAHEIISFLRKEYIPYILDSTWQYSFSNIPHSFHNYVKSLSDDFEDSEENVINSGISKILILDGSSTSKVNAFLSKNGYKLHINYHKKDNFYDITPQLDNKHQSLKKLGVNFSEVIAFGNDANDFDTLNNANVSVFLGDPQEYAAADYYCEIEYIQSFLKEISNISKSIES
ncbi:MAG: HAD-IIB family hydrolase [Proteobacteria bacterium]|nr:MAG: HAD-IIB family hydrolase [Pseudomonadota bacterium]